MIDSDAIRKRAGLSVQQWKTLIGKELEDQFAYNIDQAYERFLAFVDANLESEFEHPFITIGSQPYLSTSQVSRACMIGEFHLSNLRWRGRLMGEKIGHRVGYTRSELKHFLHDPNPYERNSALATAFLRFYERERAES